jgi:hypothetical protein
MSTYDNIIYELESISGSEIMETNNNSEDDDDKYSIDSRTIYKTSSRRTSFDFEYDLDTDLEIELDLNKKYGYITIPLHPFLIEDKQIITHDNRKTFIQTVETVTNSVKEWGPSIGYVYDEFINYDLCLKAIENHSGAICSIKPHLLIKEEYYNLCLMSVKKLGYNMKYIPKYVQTQELCDVAINSICWALQYCVNKYKTKENCFLAVKRNGQTIKHVPNKFIDYEMCLVAVKSRYLCLELIPKEFMSKEICYEAVKANGQNIKNVPDEFMSSELGWLAITSPEQHDPSLTMCGSNIQYIPAKYLTKEIIIESAKRWSSTYKTVPKQCLTDEIDYTILEVSPHCIKDMEQTPEKCLIVLKKCPFFIEDYIKKESITKEIAEYILSLDKKIKKRISNDILNYCAAKKA